MNLNKDQLEPYLLGSLHCSGLVYTRGDLSLALPIYRRMLGAGHYHLPFFMVVDFLILFTKGYEVQFRSEQNRQQDSHQKLDNEEELGIDRKLVMRYERECLGRLLQSSDIAAGIEITTTSPDPEAATERLLHQILRSVAPHYPQEYLLNPGLLRGYTLPDVLELEQFSPQHLFPLIEDFLGRLNAGVNWEKLLYEEDLFELANLENLGTDHLRVGCRQILEVSRLLRSPEPVELDLASHEDGSDTAFVDETHYPTGGLSGLTNRGSFENLLTSELVYLDEGTKDISLFELRYVEGELLFYLRDSGNLRRKRRSIHFVLDVGQVFESKLPGYDWQYSVLLQGFCLRLLHDLFEVFEMDALRFHFHYIITEEIAKVQDSFFQGEIGLMKTVLSDYTKHEWVTFDTMTEVSLEELVDPKRKSYAVILSDPSSLNKWQKQIAQLEKQDIALHTALVSVDSETPVSSGRGVAIELPRSGLSSQELSIRKDAVLEALVS